MAQLKEAHLDNIVNNYEAVEERLSDPAVSADPEKLANLSRERAKLDPLYQMVKRYREVLEQISDLEVAEKDESDKEFLQELQEEKSSLIKEEEKLSEELQYAMLPRDPAAGRNVIVEIRAGTGGDEAALFARDLFRMYTRFLERRSVPYEVLEMADTGLNGIKEVIFMAKGDEAYDLLHLEAGTHRVQRIPETESGGRIHTSACTVSVLPEADETDVSINPDDLRIDVFRASGAGGQHVNRTESAVRITHFPSGIVVSMQDEKSQHKNRAKAMQILQARLAEKIRSEEHSRHAAEKRSQIGSGDRSEKIRTYNYPQSRVTDHRINYTAHNLDKVMEGELDDLISALLHEKRQRQLAAQDEDEK